MAIQDLASNPIASGTTGQVLGYTEPTAPEEVLPLRMYNFLLYPIRQADSTREGAYFVKRLFEGPQAVWQKTQEKIFTLKDLWSLTRCPDEALQYLKNIVGWTPDLEYITDELDYDTLRRLIAASVPLWRRRGREETTLNVLALVANARCVMWNWFDYRWIIDETEFSEQHQGRDSWIIDNGDGIGEYESTLRIVDDGTLNRTLVKNIVKFMRACGERIEIVYIDFLDRFLIEDDTSQWIAASGTAVVVEDGEAKLEDTSSYQRAIADVESALEWNQYIYYARISGDVTFGNFGLLFYYTDSTHYYSFSLSAQASSWDFSLSKQYGGSTHTLYTGNLSSPIYNNQWYGVRIHVEEYQHGNRIKIYLDGEKIIDYYDLPGIMLIGTSSIGKIFRSTDFGENWVEIEDTPEAAIWSLASFANGIVLAGSSPNGKIYRSTNFGLTWVETEETDQTFILSLAIFENGIALAGSYDGGKIFRSTDYGASWVEIADTAETRIFDIATFSNGVAIAATGQNGKIYRSTDFGENWVEVEDTTEVSLNCVATFMNGNAIAGSSVGGKIFRSTDFGATWAEVEDTAETNILCIVAFSNGDALAGTSENGLILRSTNYGASWTQVEDTPLDGIQSLAVYDNGVAIACSNEDGKIYRSTDYGANWTLADDLSGVDRMPSAISIGHHSEMLVKGTVGFFSAPMATAKLSECELFQLPLDTELIDINS